MSDIPTNAHVLCTHQHTIWCHTVTTTHPHYNCYRDVHLPRSEVSLASNVHWVDCTYHGPGPALAQALVAISHGGQTVCNELAWKALQDNLPGRCQVRWHSAEKLAGGHHAV